MSEELLTPWVYYIGFILWFWAGWSTRKTYELKKRIKQKPKQR